VDSNHLINVLNPMGAPLVNQKVNARKVVILVCLVKVCFALFLLFFFHSYHFLKVFKKEQYAELLVDVIGAFQKWNVKVWWYSLFLLIAPDNYLSTTCMNCTDISSTSLCKSHVGCNWCEIESGCFETSVECTICKSLPKVVFLFFFISFHFFTPLSVFLRFCKFKFHL